MRNPFLALAAMSGLISAPLAGNSVEIPRPPQPPRQSSGPPKYAPPGVVAKLKRQARKARQLECSRQAMRAKAELIDQGKGKNGRSMSPELLERHADA